MTYHYDNIDEIIAKRFTGEINAEENALLEKWLAESPDNSLYFKQMQRLWQHSELGLPPLSQPLDVEAALARTKEKIQQHSVPKTVAMRPIWLAAAAALALILSAVWFFQPGVQPVEIAATTNTLRDTLGDGSVVSLNRNTTLTATFTKTGRRINLRGEAYFEVAHNAEKPFVIDVKQVEVTVVGTKFNVDSRTDSTKVVVSVEEGKVKVQSGSQIIFLTAGQQAVIDCGSGQILQTTLPKTTNVKGWFDRRFVFDDVPLSDVIPILEKSYGVHIVLKNKDLGNCRLHTRFTDQPLNDVMNVIKETFSLKIETQSDGYILDGEGCGN